MDDPQKSAQFRRLLCGRFLVHPIGVGCWAIGGPDHNLGLPTGWSTADDDASMSGLLHAFALGANLFDTADVYGHGHSERLLGRFVRTVPREAIVLSGKVGYFSGTAAHAYVPSHMRRQLETTLENLQTDYLDLYGFHNASFGERNRYLPGAIEQMRAFQREGLIKAVGMRGPHRFATERIAGPRASRSDKRARFEYLFECIRPDYVALRFNCLTPAPEGHPSVLSYATARGASVLITKPLAQGLLTGKHRPQAPPTFGPGDHRLRKAWFSAGRLRILHEGLEVLRARFGDRAEDLIRVALRYCLQQSEQAAVLVGFTKPEQVEQNLGCLGDPLSAEDMAFVRAAAARIQQALDSAGQVFLDE